MSWYLEFHAADRTDAKNRLTREETNNPHFRGGAAAVAALDLLPDVKNSIVYVKTTGHIDATGGNSETLARLIPLEPGL